MDESIARDNLVEASLIVDEYFSANPEALPEGLLGPLEFEYNHSKLPNAVAMQRMFHNPATGLSTANGSVQFFAGSVNTVQDGVRTILHDYGHHSSAAISARRGGNYQTRRAEVRSDNYARGVYREIYQ